MKPLSPYSYAHLPSYKKNRDIYKQQHKDRGFDSTELWNLDRTISLFVLPRLRVFREEVCSHPSQLSVEEWNTILDKMIVSFEIIGSEAVYELTTKEEHEKLQEGLELFGKYFTHLWD